MSRLDQTRLAERAESAAARDPSAAGLARRGLAGEPSAVVAEVLVRSEVVVVQPRVARRPLAPRIPSH